MTSGAPSPSGLDLNCLSLSSQGEILSVIVSEFDKQI